MSSLIWKECRLNSWVLMFGLATWLGPYLGGVLWVLLGYEPGPRPGLRWARMLEPVVVISLETTILPLLLLGANAIARERSDRSAEFLTSLPVSRARILASKAALPMGLATGSWTTGLFIAFALMPALGAGGGDWKMAELYWGIAAFHVLLFGAAWLGSSFVDTPLTAVGFSMAILLLIGFGLQAVDRLLDWPEGPSGRPVLLNWRLIVMVLVGIVGFAVGSWLYLRRVEP